MKVHVVVPDGIDDPARPSGGNAFDRQVCRGLALLGWSVHENAVPGSWPRPDAAACTALAGVVERIPDDSVVLIDGLVASTAMEVLVPQASRLRLVVLVHMPLGHRPADEGADDTRTREQRGPLGRRLRRHDERVDQAPAAGALPVARRPAARRPARRRCRRPRDRDCERPRAALRCSGDARQGARRAPRCAGDDRGLVVALRVRGQPGPRPGVRRRSPSPRSGGRNRRASEFSGTADRSRPRAQLRRRGRARAGVARRDLRHGRYRGAGPRPAGRCSRGRRLDRGPWSRRRRDPARGAGSAGGSCGARRRAPGVAHRRRAAGAVAPRRARAPCVTRRVVDHHVAVAGVLAGAAR